MSERRGEFVWWALAAVGLFGASALERQPPAASVAARPPGATRVVVWNLGGVGAAEGTPLAAEHLAGVAATLLELDCDLACVLELRDADQARELARALGGDVALLVARGARPCALLARRGALQVGGAARLTMRRPALLARWQSEALGAVHLAALHASPWSASERNAQLGRAVDTLHQRGAGAARLLLGDFNLQAQLDGGEDVFSDDAHRDVETYGYATRELADLGRSAGATATPDRRLDYVLASPELRAVAVAVARGSRRGDMDHEPLVVDLRRE